MPSSWSSVRRPHSATRRSVADVRHGGDHAVAEPDGPVQWSQPVPLTGSALSGPTTPVPRRPPPPGSWFPEPVAVAVPRVMRGQRVSEVGQRPRAGHGRTRLPRWSRCSNYLTRCAGPPDRPVRLWLKRAGPCPPAPGRRSRRSAWLKVAVRMSRGRRRSDVPAQFKRAGWSASASSHMEGREGGSDIRTFAARSKIPEAGAVTRCAVPVPGTRPTCLRIPPRTAPDGAKGRPDCLSARGHPLFCASSGTMVIPGCRRSGGAPPSPRACS